MINQSPKTSAANLLNTQEAADILNISVHTLIGWRSTYKNYSRLPHIKYNNRIVYRMEDVTELLKYKNVARDCRKKNNELYNKRATKRMCNING